MACLGGNQTHINANTRGGGVPGLLEGGVEDQLAAGGGAEPGVSRWVATEHGWQ